MNESLGLLRSPNATGAITIVDNPLTDPSAFLLELVAEARDQAGMPPLPPERTLRHALHAHLIGGLEATRAFDIIDLGPGLKTISATQLSELSDGDLVQVVGLTETEVRELRAVVAANDEDLAGLFGSVRIDGESRPIVTADEVAAWRSEAASAGPLRFHPLEKPQTLDALSERVLRSLPEDGSGVGLTVLASVTGLNRSTCRRRAEELVTWGLLSKTPAPKGFAYARTSKEL